VSSTHHPSPLSIYSPFTIHYLLVGAHPSFVRLPIIPR
jgi:hypothetical protein